MIALLMHRRGKGSRHACSTGRAANRADNPPCLKEGTVSCMAIRKGPLDDPKLRSQVSDRCATVGPSEPA